MAATVIPFQSEVVFVTLQATDTAPIVALVIVASAGNILGAFVNYWIGLRLDTASETQGFLNRFRPSEPTLARARAWWARWGVWTLLLSWAPVLGWCTVIAGAMRTPLPVFTLLVALAKTGRFIVLAWLISAV